MQHPFDRVNQKIKEGLVLNPLRYVLQTQVVYDGPLWLEHQTKTMAEVFVSESLAVGAMVNEIIVYLEYVHDGDGIYTTHSRCPESAVNWMTCRSIARANDRLTEFIADKREIRSARIVYILTRCLECPP